MNIFKKLFGRAEPQPPRPLKSVESQVDDLVNILHVTEQTGEFQGRAMDRVDELSYRFDFPNESIRVRYAYFRCKLIPKTSHAVWTSMATYLTPEQMRAIRLETCPSCGATIPTGDE